MSNFGFEYGGGGGGVNSPMGGGGGGGGGGYGSPQGGTGTPGGQQQRKRYDEQTLIPVTCRMVLNANPASSVEGTGGGLALTDGRELHQVKLIGAVRSYEDQSTNVTYQIEDGTGLVEVKQWSDDGGSPAETEMRQAACQDNVYVRVIGQVKDYDGRKTLVGYSVKKLGSGNNNELVHHMLEVVYSGETYKRGNTIVGVGGGGGQDQKPYGMQQGGGGGVGFGGGGVGGGGMMGHRGAPMAAAAGGMSGSLGNDVNEVVLNWIRDQGGAEVGANITKCIQDLSASRGYTEGQIRAAVQHNAQEGHIYSTINEDHYTCAM